MWTTVLECLSLALMIGGFVLVGRAYPKLSDQIPIHFGFSGEPDAWGPRAAIWLLPAVGAGISLLFIAIALLLPSNPGRAVMAAEEALTQAMFFYIERQQIAVALGKATRIGSAIWVFVAATLVVPFLVRLTH